MTPEEIERLIANVEDAPQFLRALTEEVNRLRQVELKLDIAREALRAVNYTSRSRGYPTGGEWDQLVRLVDKALGESK